MNSTPAPKAGEPREAPAAGADERLAHAYKQIVSADEQLARLSEQVARMERNAGRARSAGVGLKSAAGRRPLAVIGLALASCIIVAALTWQWSLGGGPVAEPSPTQLALAVSLPPENPPRETRAINGRNPLGGAKVANLSPAAALDFGLDLFSKGVVVVDVADNSYAAAQGFQTGDIIRSVNGADINRVDDLTRALNAGNRWNIAMERGGRRLVLSFAD